MAQLSPLVPGRYTIEIGNDRYAVEIAGDNLARVNGEEATLEIEAIGRGEYRVSNAAGSWRVFVAGVDERREVFVEGEVYQCEVHPEGASRPAARSPLESLAAPMPARVVAVNVRPGESVKRGDILVTLEAMKMELSVRAPRDGLVRRLACEPGQLVQPGVRLIELD